MAVQVNDIARDFTILIQRSV